jgi:hypothetical protein
LMELKMRRELPVHQALLNMLGNIQTVRLRKNHGVLFLVKQEVLCPQRS